MKIVYVRLFADLTYPGHEDSSKRRSIRQHDGPLGAMPYRVTCS
jgi:hypothetical protein